MPEKLPKSSFKPAPAAVQAMFDESLAHLRGFIPDEPRVDDIGDDLPDDELEQQPVVETIDTLTPEQKRRLLAELEVESDTP